MRNDSQALVSVIVPIYNVEKYLDQCLDSIEAQTHRNIEVLCINDGSTDGSRDIMAAHAKKDPRVRVIDKENGGYGQGCNLGLSLAKGEWVSIVEPDDWIDPTMYEDMLAFASTFDEQLDIVKTPWTDICDWDNPKKQHPHRCSMKGKIQTSERPFTLSENPLLIEHHPSIWSAIYRRGFLEEKKIRFPEYPGAGWADNPFLVETMCQAEAIVYLDRAYYNYRRDLPGSTRHHKTAEAVERPFDRWDDMLDIIERLGITDERILAGHYVRGFNYAHGARYDDGMKNPLVVKRVHEMVAKMDPGIVERSEQISPFNKKFFAEQRGLPYNKSRLAYLIEEFRFSCKTEGLLFVLESAFNHFTGRYMPED